MGVRTGGATRAMARVDFGNVGPGRAMARGDFGIVGPGLARGQGPTCVFKGRPTTAQFSSSLPVLVSTLLIIEHVISDRIGRQQLIGG